MNREFLPTILEGILFYESVIFILIKQLAMRILKIIHGGLAQLGERLAGSQKVSGSIPLVSTIHNEKPLEESRGLFFLFVSRILLFCKLSRIP